MNDITYANVILRDAGHWLTCTILRVCTFTNDLTCCLKGCPLGVVSDVCPPVLCTFLIGLLESHGVLEHFSAF